MKNLLDDIDPIETQEWLEALASVIENEGLDRARFIIDTLLADAQKLGIPTGDISLTTPYCNTISLEQEPTYPGDIELEKKIEAINRWNAIAMVIRAKRNAGGVGGHLSSYASIATLYEVGMNHFFHGATPEIPGDLIYFQGHSSEGNYARAFLEGRLSETNLINFRQEIGGEGVSSYPHPWLMPNFWQFATVSLGLGPLQAIYQARFIKYLENRKLIPENHRKVWVFAGDGEMDEPESTAGLTMAVRENLDNIIYVVNCNLQRLDGPVRSHGKIVQELEGLFKGAGWNVIKVIWSHHYDALFAKDTKGLLLKRLTEILDGGLQTSYVSASIISKTRITEPCETLSPTLIFTSFTTPASDEGTSIVALSDSKVTKGESTLMVSPGFTKTSITSTSEAPTSGTVIFFITKVNPPLYGYRIWFVRINIIFFYRCRHFSHWNCTFFSQSIECSYCDMMSIVFKEMT
jgi:pyruvate dehydrogenase E1 component